MEAQQRWVAGARFEFSSCPGSSLHAARVGGCMSLIASYKDNCDRPCFLYPTHIRYKEQYEGWNTITFKEFPTIIQWDALYYYPAVKEWYVLR